MPARGTPHICFLGSAPNVGDTAIGQSILQGLKTHTGLPVRIHTDRPDAFIRLPEVSDADQVRDKLPMIARPSERFPTFPVWHHLLLRDLRSTGGARLLPTRLYTTLREAFNGCTAVVFQGGPQWNWMTRRKAIDRWYLLEAARHYGAHAYHVGVSCGPFHWPLPQQLRMAPLYRKTLDCHDILFVRDSFSSPELHRIGVTTRIVNSTDAAVFLSSYPDAAFAPLTERIGRPGRRPRLVVCVRDFQAFYADAVQLQQTTLQTLARVLDYIQEHLADIYFLGTDHKHRVSKKTDVETAHVVRQNMKRHGAEIIETEVWNPSVLKHVYGQFDAMISMRLHPTILALGCGVPCLLLSYDPKCDDFFRRLGLSDYAVALAEFERGSFIEKVRRILGDNRLRQHIQSRYEELKRAHADDYEPMYAQIRQRAGRLVAPVAGPESTTGFKEAITEK